MNGVLFDNVIRKKWRPGAPVLMVYIYMVIS